MIWTRILLIAVSLASLLYLDSVEGSEIEIGLHYVKTEKPHNGLWYQEEFDHSIDRTDLGYQIGLRWKYDKIHLSTGYKYLGEFSVDAEYIANDDNYYDWQDGLLDAPTSNLKAKGKAHGIYFKGEYHFESFYLVGRRS